MGTATSDDMSCPTKKLVVFILSISMFHEFVLRVDLSFLSGLNVD